MGACSHQFVGVLILKKLVFLVKKYWFDNLLLGVDASNLEEFRDCLLDDIDF